MSHHAFSKEKGEVLHLPEDYFSMELLRSAIIKTKVLFITNIINACKCHFTYLGSLLDFLIVFLFYINLYFFLMFCNSEQTLQSRVTFIPV